MAVLKRLNVVVPCFMIGVCVGMGLVLNSSFRNNYLFFCCCVFCWCYCIFCNIVVAWV